MLRKALHWIIDHATWDVAVRLLEKWKLKAAWSAMVACGVAVAEWFEHRTWPELLVVGLATFVLVLLTLELWERRRGRRQLREKDNPQVSQATNQGRLALEVGRSPSLAHVERGFIRATSFKITNAETRFENTCHNVHAAIRFTHCRGETLTSQAFLAECKSDFISDESPVKSVSLESEDFREVLAFVTILDFGKPHAYYTLSQWPFDQAKELRLQHGNWTMELEITCDSKEDSIQASWNIGLHKMSTGFSPVTQLGKPPSQH